MSNKNERKEMQTWDELNKRETELVSLINKHQRELAHILQDKLVLACSPISSVTESKNPEIVNKPNKRKEYFSFSDQQYSFIYKLCDKYLKREVKKQNMEDIRSIYENNIKPNPEFKGSEFRHFINVYKNWRLGLPVQRKKGGKKSGAIDLNVVANRLKD